MSGMINVELDKRLSTIEPELFGCLIESYGTLLDGIWVGDEDIPNDDGLRLDTIDALRQLGIRVIRFPGGTPADHYRWRDGIGPRSERPRTWQFFFGGEDSNAFGTHEFVRFCEGVGATPSIKLNPISGTLHDALDWMQYCNYNGDTDLANERRANGHPAPLGVKSWVIGNEAADAWSPETYAELVFRWTFFMRQVDPAAKIIAEGWSIDWNERFLKRFSEMSRGGGVVSHDVAALSSHDIDVQPGGKFHMLGLKYPDEQTLSDAIAMIDRYFDGALELCVEEWEGQTAFTCGWPQEWVETMTIYDIVLHQGRSNLKYENETRLDGALKAAEKMHRWMRHAEYVKMTTYLYPTNTWAPLLKTRGAELIRTPQYHALAMLHYHAGNVAVGVGTDSRDGLDVIASISEDDRELTVSLLNQDADNSANVTLKLDDGSDGVRSGTARLLTGDQADENTFESPERVTPGEHPVQIQDGMLSVSCPPVSLTVLRCELNLTEVQA